MKDHSKKQALRRLKILAGQVRGLERMVEDDQYCIDVITQTGAIKQALSSLEDLILENHLATCVIHQMKSGRESKAVQEILSVYKLSKKK